MLQFSNAINRAVSIISGIKEAHEERIAQIKTDWHNAKNLPRKLKKKNRAKLERDYIFLTDTMEYLKEHNLIF